MASYIKDNEVEKITIDFKNKTVRAKLKNDESDHFVTERLSLSSAGGLAVRTVRRLLVTQINENRR